MQRLSKVGPKVAAVVAIVVIATTACTGSKNASAEPDAVVSVPESGSTIVNSAWVSQRSASFFVDRPLSADGSVWSLDLTYWNVLSREAAGVRSEDLDSAAVGRWVAPMLTNRNEANRTASNIQYAAQILRSLDVRIPRDRALRALADLSKDGRYRFVRGQQPDWGATAIAVQTFDTLGSPVPDATVERIQSAVGRATGQDWDANQVVSTLVPLIISAAYIGASADELQPLAEQAQEFLDSNPDSFVALASSALLHSALEADDAPTPQVASSVCPSSAPDVQTAYYSWVLGCDGIEPMTAAADSISGWLAPSYADGNLSLLSSSRAGYMLEGGDATHRSGLRAWITDTYYRHAPVPFEEYNRVKLWSALGLHSIARMPRPKGAMRRSAGATIWATEVADLLRDKRVDLRTDEAWLHRYLDFLVVQGRRMADANSMFEAAALETGARAYHNHRWHNAAVRVAERLHERNGTYALSELDNQSSMLSTALGAWVLRRPVQQSRLIASGMCSTQGCQDRPALSPDAVDVSLIATLQAEMAGSPGAELPLFIS